MVVGSGLPTPAECARRGLPTPAELLDMAREGEELCRAAHAKQMQEPDLDEPLVPNMKPAGPDLDESWVPNIHLGVKNMLSPYYCGEEIKEAFAKCQKIPNDYYLRKQSTEDEVFKRMIKKETEHAIRWINSTQDKDAVTILLLQECWPELHEAIKHDTFFAVPEELHGNFGTAVTVCHIGEHVSGNATVTEIKHHDLAQKARDQEGLETIKGTNNYCTLDITVGAQDYKFVSGHLQYDRKADRFHVAELEKLKSDAEREGKVLCLGWDESDYKPSEKTHWDEFLNKFVYKVAEEGESPDGCTWVTAAYCSKDISTRTWKLPKMYDRSDHQEFVAIDIHSACTSCPPRKKANVSG